MVDDREEPNVELTISFHSVSVTASVYVLNIAGPASSRTVVIKTGFDWPGKDSVKSRELVIRDPSLTGLMGSSATAAASSEFPLTKTSKEASRTSSVDSPARHWLSLALHDN